MWDLFLRGRSFPCPLILWRIIMTTTNTSAREMSDNVAAVVFNLVDTVLRDKRRLVPHLWLSPLQLTPRSKVSFFDHIYIYLYLG